METVHKTFQVRGFLSRRGYVRLDTVLRRCATLYNAGLEEWREAYRMTGVSLGYLEQFKEFTSVRAEDPFWTEVDARVGRGVLRRLDRARVGFYRRVKEGAKPGYPRFKSGKRWRTVELAGVGSSMVRNGQVRVKGLPPIDIRPVRKLPPSKQLKGLKITRSGRRVTVNLVYAVENEALPPSSTCVGVSLEGGQRATLSDGTAFRTSDRHWPDIIRKHQRLARCKKGSREWVKQSRILGNAYRRRQIANRNECHRMTSRLVGEFGHIGVGIQDATKQPSTFFEVAEDNCTTSTSPSQGITDETGSIQGLILRQLAYKASWAGRQLVEVDPKTPFITCSSCGSKASNGWNESAFRCVPCGNVMDGGHNAAVNILHLSMAGGNSPPPAPEPAEIFPPLPDRLERNSSPKLRPTKF
jgi:putative transposase